MPQFTQASADDRRGADPSQTAFFMFFKFMQDKLGQGFGALFSFFKRLLDRFSFSFSFGSSATQPRKAVGGHDAIAAPPRRS